MKDDLYPLLLSIRRILVAIFAVLLLSFGFAHTPIANTELGGMIAIIALIAGFLILCAGIGIVVTRFLINLRDITDGEDTASTDKHES